MDLVARALGNAELARSRQRTARERLREEHPELVELLEVFALAFQAVPAKVTVGGKSIGKSIPDRRDGRVVPDMPQVVGIGVVNQLCDDRFARALDAYNRSHQS